MQKQADHALLAGKPRTAHSTKQRDVALEQQ
jgi:hypothetical protein